MENQPSVRIPSSESNAWTWIILAVLLVLGALIGVGLLALTNFTQQSQMPTGSQTVPGR
jgi:hypothetical protein